MRIAFLIERFEPARGGMETSAAEFLTEIIALGAQVDVLTERGKARIPGLELKEFRTATLSRAGRYRQFVEAASQHTRVGHWDVVHAVTPCVSCDLYQPRSGVFREALERTVAARRGVAARWLRRWSAWMDGKQRLLARLERELLTRQDPPWVAALSSYMRRQLEDSYALLPAKVRDVFNGVTVELPPEGEQQATRRRLRGELSLSDQARVVLFAGHNFRRKGLRSLLTALARPEAASWMLLVAGKDRPERYQRLARELDVSKRVRFLGSRRDASDLYLASDVVALPTYYDPCSRTILEAMSLGRPCITTRYDGSADCIVHGVNGFVMSDPEAIEELAGALAALADEESRFQMGERALALRPRLSMRRHAEEIMELYEAIAAEESRRNRDRP